MTAKEAYNLYCEHYKTNQWTREDVLHYLKPNWIDYEEYNFEEFKDKILTDDKFNERWANGCTRPLSTQERKDLYDKTDYSKDIFPTDENGWNKLFNSYNIPNRTIID